MVCAILALIATTGLTKASSSGNLTTIPLVGGVYREGLVGNSTRDLENAHTYLTDVGLVGLSDTGEVVPALATKWDVSDDSQTIRLTLDNHLSASHALDILKQQTDPGYWNDAEIKAPDAQTLEFHVTKPWAGFLSELSTPIFPYGPFQLTKAAKNQDSVISYEPNPHALQKPYLTRVELHLFPDQRNLERAIRKGTIDAAYTPEDMVIPPPHTWDHPDLTTQREYLLFFNLKNERLADKTIRQKIIKGERLDDPLQLRLVVPDIPAVTSLAEDLAGRLAGANIQLVTDREPLITINKSLIPNRDYDLLIMGVDYGADQDLYPYWHSSQIAPPGLNLDGYRNKDLDQLLERARTEHDQAKRHDLYNQVRKLLDDEALDLSLGRQPVHFIRSQQVKGPIPAFVLSPNGRWKDIASWYERAKYVKKTA